MAERDQHLDLLTLDAVRAGETADGAAAAHLAACSACQEQLAELGDLATALKALHAAPADPAVDARIAWLAQGHAARAKRAQPSGWQRRVRAPAAWAAAAVAVLALASALLLGRREQPSGEPFARVPALRGDDVAAADLDRDGRVTVLDAFALARSLERHTEAGAGDVNHDARVDENDVETVLATAVSVRDT
jgi:anti-sigma factor RsiW